VSSYVLNIVTSGVVPLLRYATPCRCLCFSHRE